MLHHGSGPGDCPARRTTIPGTGAAVGSWRAHLRSTVPAAASGAGGWMEPAAAAGRPREAGTGARVCGVAMTMTQQYLAGELSVLLERVQAVATTEAASRDAKALREAAETVPVQALGWVTVRALALTERFCWDSLSRGDTAAFTRQAAAEAALREFGICASLLRDD